MNQEGRRKKAPPPPSKPPPRGGRAPPPKKPPSSGGAGRGKNAAAQWRLKNSTGKPSSRNDDEFDDLQAKKRPPRKGSSRYQAPNDYSDDDDEGPRDRRQPSHRKKHQSDVDDYDDPPRSNNKARRPPPRNDSRNYRRRDVDYADGNQDEEDLGDRDRPSSRQSNRRAPKDQQAWGRDGRSSKQEDLVEDIVDEVEEITIDASDSTGQPKKGGRGGPPSRSPGRQRPPSSGRGGKSKPSKGSRYDEDWNRPLDIYDDDGDVDTPAWTQNRGPVDYADTTMESTYSDYGDDADRGRHSQSQRSPPKKRGPPSGRGGRGSGRGRGGREEDRGGGRGQMARKSARGRDYSSEEDDEILDERGPQGQGDRRGRDPDRSSRGRDGSEGPAAWTPRDERHGAPEWRPQSGKRSAGRQQYDRYSDEEEYDEDIREEYQGNRRDLDDLDEDRDRRALGGLPWKTSRSPHSSDDDHDDLVARARGRNRSRVPEMPSPSVLLNPVLYDYRNIPFALRDLQDFVTNPPPGGPGTMVHCFIQRDRSGTKKLAPVYTLYSDHEDGSGRLILSARKVLKSKTPYYVISTQREDLFRHRTERSHHYLGKLRGNSTQTEYIMFDSGDNPSHLNQRETDSDSDMEHGSLGGRSASNTNSTGEVREELAVIHYVREKKQDGLRRMEVGTPKLKYFQDSSHPDGGNWQADNWRPQREMDTMAHKFARVRQEGGQNVVAADRLFMMHKRESRYDPLSSCLVDFKGRARQASVKNYQLVKSWPTEREMRRQYFSSGGEGADEVDDEEAAKPVLLQMGKFGKDCFNMDYQWPLSMLQAFGICLSRFDTKLYY